MGMNIFGSRCTDTSHNRDEGTNYRRVEYMYVDRISGNPNPKNFTITKTKVVGRFLIAEVTYPDCRNFEGKKILVFAGMTAEALRKLSSLDPHFCNTRAHPSPVARFVPSDLGWEYAISFCLNV